MLFTTRGDIYHNKLARSLGAEVGAAGEVLVDQDQRTTVPGLYAAGCLTPALSIYDLRFTIYAP